MAKKKAKTTTSVTAAQKASTRDYSIFTSSVVTEKSSHIGNGGSTVTFKVDKRSTKNEIKAAFERIFNKEVASVRTANFVGKPKKRTKEEGRTASYKKAIITLKNGETIDIVGA